MLFNIRMIYYLRIQFKFNLTCILFNLDLFEKKKSQTFVS